LDIEPEILEAKIPEESGEWAAVPEASNHEQYLLLKDLLFFAGGKCKAHAQASTPYVN
jgi:hypothetical protein